MEDQGVSLANAGRENTDFVVPLAAFGAALAAAFVGVVLLVGFVIVFLAGALTVLDLANFLGVPNMPPTPLIFDGFLAKRRVLL